MSRVSNACSALVLGLAVQASAQSTWIEQPTIPARSPLVSAYDASRERVVAFTKSLDGPAETWEWDGRAWTRQVVGGPQALTGTKLAYSPADRSPLLFGGDGYPTGSNQQWRWTGDLWVPLAGQPIPDGRGRTAMASDPTRSSLLLFGGAQGLGSTTVTLGDTWERTATGWRALQPTMSPPARADAAMAFDPSTGNMLLFGGFSSPAFQLFHDTWSWNGAQWTQVATTGPQFEIGTSMVADFSRQRVVLFTPSRETWEWNGSQWTRAGASGQSPPSYVTLAYDQQRGQTVAFGAEANGLDASTWRWTGATWVAFSHGNAPGQRAVAMAEDAIRGTVVLVEGGASAGTTWTFDGLEWSLRPAAPIPVSGRASMAGDPVNGIVLFDVGNPSTWVWNGTAWSQALVPGPAGTPFAVSMAYDEARKETILLDSGAYASIGTWAWNGSQWQQRASPAASPIVPKFLATKYQLAYDRQRQRIVAYAGEGQAPDTWEWDGSSWTRIVPPISPPLRTDFMLAYSPDLGRVILHGGGTPYTPMSDTWSWNGSRWSLVPTAGHAAALTQAAAATHTASNHVVLFGGRTLVEPNATWLLGRGPKAMATERTTWCQGSLRLSPFGRPALGNGSFALDVEYAALNTVVGALVGVPATMPFGSCTLGVDPTTAVALLGQTNGYGFASIPLPIPNVPALLGGTFGTQAASVSPFLPSRIDLSTAWAMQIGY